MTFTEPKPVTPEEIERSLVAARKAVEQLAQEAGVETPRVVASTHPYATYVNRLSRTITVGTQLLVHMPAPALRAVLAHEVAHLQTTKPMFKKSITKTVGVMALTGTSQYVITKTVPRQAQAVAQGVTSAAILAGFFLDTLATTRKEERRADQEAARLTSAKDMAAGLQWFDDRHKGKDRRPGLLRTHDPIEKRINDLS